MDQKAQAIALKSNPLLKKLLDARREDIVSDMLAEPKRKRREALWHETHYIDTLSERIDIELDSIIGGDSEGREPEA